MLQPPAPPSTQARPSTSTLAVASLVSGILIFATLFAALPAIICGHLALRRIRQSAGSLAGRGLARAGLVLGYLVVVSFVVSMILGIIAENDPPFFRFSNLKGKGTKDLTNAKQIALAIKLYEIDNNDRTPPNLDALCPGYIYDRNLFKSPLATDGSAQGYDFLLPNIDTKTIDEKTTVMIRGRYTDWWKKRSWVYADMHGTFARHP